jgi:hypothetical protein
MRQLIFNLMLIISPYIFGQTISFQVAPQEISLDYINKYDSIGNKSGYWCDMHDEFITFDYYSLGKKNGLRQVYKKNPTTKKYYLAVSGYYCDDVPCSQWQYYHKNGVVRMNVSRISKNRDYLKEAKELGYSTPSQTLQCYVENYDRGSSKKSEGWYIFQEDFEIDGKEVGKQIQYEY